MKRLSIFLLSLVMMSVLTIPAFAYVDPSVTAFAIQGISAIIVLVATIAALVAIIAAVFVFIRRRR